MSALSNKISHDTTTTSRTFIQGALPSKCKAPPPCTTVFNRHNINIQRYASPFVDLTVKQYPIALFFLMATTHTERCASTAHTSPVTTNSKFQIPDSIDRCDELESNPIYLACGARCWPGLVFPPTSTKLRFTCFFCLKRVFTYDRLDFLPNYRRSNTLTILCRPNILGFEALLGQ